MLLLINIIYNKERKFNEKNETPLHSAAMNDSIKIAEKLILKGAKMNPKGINSLKMKL